MGIQRMSQMTFGGRTAAHSGSLWASVSPTWAHSVPAAIAACAVLASTPSSHSLAPEHRERAAAVDLGPRQVNEAPSRSALDVRSTGIKGSVDDGRGRAFQAPGHRWGVARLQVQPLGRLVTTLHADVDVVASGEAGAGCAITAGKIVAVDADSQRLTLIRLAPAARPHRDESSDRPRSLSRVIPCDFVSEDHLSQVSHGLP